MKYLVFTAVTILLAITFTPAQKNLDRLIWENGRISDNQFNERVDSVEGQDITTGFNQTIYMRDDLETLVIENDDYVYLIQRKLGFIWQKRIRFTDPNNIKFAVHKDDLFLKNAKGKEVRYKIVERRKAEPENTEKPNSDRD
jgi:hypothetical protein